MKKHLDILPPTYLLICIIITFLLHFSFPIKKVLDSFQIIGVLLISFGIIINVWTDNLFKKSKTTVKPQESPSTLITNGPFKFSRHPMYLGFVLLLLGISITLGSLSSFLGPIFMCITLEKIFIPSEEKIMEKQFGKKYLIYKNKVPRWI